MRYRARVAFILLLLPALTYAIYLFAPLGDSLRMSFNGFGRRTGIQSDLSTSQYKTIITDEFYREVWFNTLRITLEAAAATVVLGTAIAYGMWRVGGRVRAYLTALILAPLLVSGVVRAYGWIAVGGPRGPWEAVTTRVGLDGVDIIFNETGVIIGFVHVFMPFAVILTLVRLDAVKPSVIRAARDLGATQLDVVRRVLLPAAAPAVASAFLLVFALATSSYSVPAILGGGRVATVAQTIVAEHTATFNWPRAAALAISLTVLTVTVMLVYERFVGGRARRAAAVPGT